MHIRIRLITYVWMLLCLLATACTSIGFELPQGPQGPDGKSAYDLWKEEVEAGRINWPGDRTTPADFFVFVIMIGQFLPCVSRVDAMQSLFASDTIIDNSSRGDPERIGCLGKNTGAPCERSDGKIPKPSRG